MNSLRWPGKWHKDRQAKEKPERKGAIMGETSQPPTRAGAAT
jgi:hypothetical protein